MIIRIPSYKKKKGEKPQVTETNERGEIYISSDADLSGWKPKIRITKSIISFLENAERYLTRVEAQNSSEFHANAGEI